MTAQATLLIEITTEELPAKSLGALGEAFAAGVHAALGKRGLALQHSPPRALYTPRRLALLIEAVPLRQPDRIEERRGPARSAAFDPNGAPSKALLGFAASAGVEPAQLIEVNTDKGVWMAARIERPGAATASVLPEVLQEAIAALPIAKPMRWGARSDGFVRPVLGLMVLLGDQHVAAQLFGVASGTHSLGHRVHHPAPVNIARADDYIEALRDAQVLVDPVERAASISAQVAAAAAALGGEALAPPALLDEVTNLTEWPRAITCSFDRAFLQVPAAALIETMQANQKFFAVLDAHGALTEHFIGIANLESSAPDEVRKGYERVIRPRFADAQFFYQADSRTPLAEHQQALAKITWQRELGSVWDKSCRVAELARTIAGRVGVDGALATQAAALAKCDLATRMVGEFPELQGTMGRHYAQAQGFSHEVAQAIEESYAPRAAGAPIAASPLGRVVAVADKLDTLAGLFAVGLKPSGNKDPFSLRRNALGLARTLIEGQVPLALEPALLEAIDLSDKQRDAVARSMPALSTQAASKPAAKTPPATPAQRAAELYEFIVERLRGYYGEQGVPASVFDAVASVRPDELGDFDARLRAVIAFAALPEAASLAAAHKRIGNLLRQAAEKSIAPAARIDSALLEAGAESALAAALVAADRAVEPALAARDYVAALKHLAALRAPVDAFFDDIMVMVDDAALRANRLALLLSLRNRFMAIADIGVL